MALPKIRLTVTTLFPFYKVIKDGDQIRMEGFISIAAEFLRRTFNVSEVLVSEDGIGYEVSPGNWTGCIGMMHRNEADIFAGYLVSEAHLFKFIDFSAAFDAVTLSVLSGPPRNLNSDMASLFSSIAMQVWVWLGVTWVLVSILYRVFCPLEGRFLQTDTPKDSLIECFLTFYGLLFQRGFDNLPSTMALRLLVSGWLILVIVLMTDMGGTLSSKLAVTDVPERIDRVQDILMYPKLKPYIPRGIVADMHLETAEDPELVSVWRQVQRFSGVKDPDLFYEQPLMDEVVKGEAVIISVTEPCLGSIVSHECSQRIRPLYLAKEPFLSVPVSYLFRRGLDRGVVELLNRRVIEHGGTGFGLLLWRKCSQFARPCYAEAGVKGAIDALTVRDLSQLYKILGFGMVSSLAVFLFEVAVVKAGKRDTWAKALL